LPFAQNPHGKGTENSKLPLQIGEARSEMAQIISTDIQLQEVSNEHSMEAQQIKNGKASSNKDCFPSLSFSNKGNKQKVKLPYNKTSSQNLFHCCSTK